jgi:amidase
MNQLLRSSASALDIGVLSYAMPYGLTGWPAVVMRVGSTPDGLPVGVQIVAHPWREDVALAAAQRLEAIGDF